MSEPYLRRADEDDIDLLFNWVNDVVVRQNAFNTKKIEYSDHKKWFYEKLNSDSSIIYIYCVEDGTPVGQVRIDIDNDYGLISYSIDACNRMHGHGGRLLMLLEDIVLQKLPEVDVLVARVKKNNVSSQRRFEKLGYRCVDKDECFEYRKIIAINDE